MLNAGESLISDYLKEYGPVDGDVDIEDFLRPWHEAKSKYLLPIFKNQLTTSMEVKVVTPEKKLRKNMVKQLIHNPIWDNSITKLSIEMERILHPSDLYDFMNDAEKSAHDVIHVIKSLRVEADILVDNAMPNTIILRPAESNKLKESFKVQAGQKPFRFINNCIKLLKTFYSISDDRPQLRAIDALAKNLEDMRLIHSQVLNEREYQGKLVLSIHPFDYLTMSDNESDWDSCMTWQRCNPGEYRLGTLEMMNSPCVVVAYLESREEYTPLNDGRVWNNKKWRELFIVDRNFILGIKGYPYNSAALEDIIFDKLAEMCEEHDWPRYDRTPQLVDECSIEIQDISIEFNTDFMYNDVNWNVCRCIKTKEADMTLEYLKDNFYNYSGPAYCIECGERISYDNFARKSMVRCMDCENVRKCAHCGEIIESYQKSYWFDGKDYCEDCVTTCEVCGEQIPYDSLESIFIFYRRPDVPAPFYRRDRSSCCGNCVKTMIKQNKVAEVNLANTLYTFYPEDKSPCFVTTPAMDKETLSDLDLTLEQGCTIIDLTEYRV